MVKVPLPTEVAEAAWDALWFSLHHLWVYEEVSDPWKWDKLMDQTWVICPYLSALTESSRVYTNQTIWIQFPQKKDGKMLGGQKNGKYSL